MSKLENAVPGYKYLIVEPYTPNIGAVIHDFDLANIGDEGVRAELRKALVEFQVLFFRKQQLTPEQQIAVARVFGDPDKAKAFFPRHATQNLIEVLETRPVGHRYGTDQWHADITFSANPPTGTVLYSHVIPPSGGDTLWASASAVYDSLPKSLQAYLEELEAVHSFEHSGWPNYFAQLDNGEAIYRQARADHLPVVHPVIRTHPETGEKVLFVNAFTTHFVNYHTQKRVRFGQDYNKNGSDLMQYLISQAYNPEYQVRWRWKPYSMAIWDNRSTQHYAVMDYPPCHRKMERAGIIGEKTY